MELNRREFLKASAAVGGGLALEFSFPLSAMAAKGLPPTEVNAWVVIHPDNRVVVRFARSEMGQGTYTALAQLVAEELDADWSKVSSEFASPNEHIRRKRIWGSMSTGGSQGVRSSQDYVRKAGAAARIMLVEAAAARWKVPAGECIGANSVVTHVGSGRTLRYGQLAADAAKLTPPKDPPLRDAKDWKIAGKPMRRFDVPDKVLGKPVFGVDVVLPGMLHASIAQCPVFGGKVKSMDASAAEKMRGVKKVVRESEFVAVIADSWWRADQALKKVSIEWDEGANGNVSSESILKLLRDGLAEPKLAEARKVGDATTAMAAAAKVIEAEYYSPYVNHATMEPQTCTAWFKADGTLEVWTSTQNAEASMAMAAETAGLPLEKVEVHKPMLGGGFGRRGASQDFVKQGVLIAKAMPGTPVKMMWSRAEDMQHGYYRPASLVRMKAGLDAKGDVAAMQVGIACPSILALLRPEAINKGVDFTAVRTLSDMPYTIPHQQIDYAMRNPHVPVGFWRAPGLQNAYYRECFIDELAVAAGRDPLEYRLAMLKPGDKNRLVLEAVAKAANWGGPLPAGVHRGIAVSDGFGSFTAMVAEVSVSAKAANWGSTLPPGVHRGIAVSDGFGSFTAMVAEVSVSAKGELKVHRVVSAIDSGYVVNPDTCRAQSEGNIAFMLGATKYQENTVAKGRMVEANFNEFQLLGISEMPKVETVLVPTGGFWGGHGEPGALCVAPALCNAIYAATGKRIRSLPLKHHDLRKA